ncbi:PBP1A family penicillin-binding protein [Ligilactobacillus sp. LYQ60]|uniref:PBP1A family penicillin-binding protein n=1 Tax=unclassified Ligilactobacillus TaxID=2767920 RepID=UPI0038547882
MTEQDPHYSRTARHQTREKEEHQRHSHCKHRFWGWALGIIAFLIVAGGFLFVAYASTAPKLSISRLSSPEMTTIYASNGKKIYTLGSENRQIVKQNQIPQQLKDAIVSIEDRGFYKQKGIDPLRIVSAAFSNIFHPNAIQGGSTLDQQLVKLSYFSTSNADRTLKRKAQEAWLAIQLDKHYSKNQIMTFYVNKVYMGSNCYGMQTAAHYYYGKPLKDLNLAQTATIAGIPNAPASYDPLINPKLATQRRNLVLDAMVQNKKISSAQAAAAKQQSITAGLITDHAAQNDENSKRELVADAYIQQVLQEAKQQGYDPNKGNLKIYTNLDWNVQKRLYAIANTDEYIVFPNNRLQMASTVINPQNGKVIAMIGGRKSNTPFGLNRAVQTNRSNGSCAKPLMDYGPAIQYLHWATYHPLEDTPYKYPGTNTSLYDWDHKYPGKMTLRSALVQSRNIPAIRTLSAVGLSNAQNFLGNLGFDSSKVDKYSYGIGIPSSTLQNAAAYSSFANGGTYYKPQFISKIKSTDGNVKTFSVNGQRAMKPGTAYMITDILKGVFKGKGTATDASIPGLYVAGKDGETNYPDSVANKVPAQSCMDGWMNGYTKNYAVSVWVGYDHPMHAGNYMSIPEAKISHSIFKNEMTYLAELAPNTDWIRPSSVGTKTLNGVKQLYWIDYPDSDIFAGNSSSGLFSHSGHDNDHSFSMNFSIDMGHSNSTNNNNPDVSQAVNNDNNSQQSGNTPAQTNSSH